MLVNKQMFMNYREKQILTIIRDNPFIQQNAIADMLGITRSSVAGYIMTLTQKGYIKGKGYLLSENNHIVVVGSSNMDVTGYSNKKLVYGDSNPGKIRCTPGGVGRNIAENLALLDRDTYLISTIGDDFYGAQLIEHTRKAGVNMDNSHIIKGDSTSTYLSLLDESGEMLLAINDMDIIDKLTPNLLKDSQQLIHHAKLLVIDCNLQEDALAWLFSHAGSVPIFVDTVSAFKSHKIKDWLSHIHTLKPNRLEAEILSGMKIHSNQDIPKIVDWFHEQGVKRIAISVGADGVYYSEINGERGWSVSIPTKIVSVTGAGDAMLAGLIHGYLDNMNFYESIRFGQACSSLTLSSEFTNNPNLSINCVQNILESFS